ncbi:phytanoyl-CoA dioxygenase family protein [Myxococcota bacterium]|nr:phytanoyl-CoA dioxygenase family protein [Myxococcota bacterium]
MIEGFETIDFHAFHTGELPRRLQGGNAPLAARSAQGLSPLGIRMKGSDDAYAYVPRDGGIDIVRGDASAGIVIEIDQDTFDGLVHDVETPPGMIYGGRVEKLRGDMMEFVRWEPALRAMFHGRALYEAGNVDLSDRHGQPLDPAQTFALDSHRDDMAHFLRTTGYLCVKNVFSSQEVEAMREGAATLRERAVEGDQVSWWGRNDAGESVLCRVLSAGVLPVFSSIPTEPRLKSLAELSDHEWVSNQPRAVDGVSVLWKNPSMNEGLSDLPWHRDCGMGGHATMCPTLVCSIFLEANTPEHGALRFLPGSWRYAFGFLEPDDPNAPTGVAPPAEPGDVTLHYGDGMHVAPPPTHGNGPFRTCVLTAFQRADAHHHRGERHYNDVLLGAEDGQVEHMSKAASRF